jgi:NADPH:quinone reductase-like Zn-dependent oxidoreductase
MKAAICTAYGSPEVLQLRTVPKPIPKDHEILIKIKATAVNSGDVRVRGLVVQGLMKIIMRVVLGITRPRKPILGSIIAGVVEEVGSNVTAFKVGDEIFGMTGLTFGTYAEYIALNQKATIVPKPLNASWEEAAAIVFGGSTAIHFLDKAGIKNEHSVDGTDQDKNLKKILIYGATGSVGTSAVQLAKYYNAQVTAVCSSQGFGLMNALGIESVIDYTTVDFTTLKEKYDAIFDAVGKTTKKQWINNLTKGGKFLTVGGLDVAAETKDQLQLLKLMFETKQLNPVIDKTYSLDSIVQAHTYVDEGHKQGNVVIKVG